MTRTKLAANIHPSDATRSISAVQDRTSATTSSQKIRQSEVIAAAHLREEEVLKRFAEFRDLAFRDGFAAVVDLHEGEALATSATYYRGSHIYDGRTGLAVSNGVASVTVLCNSAMWADGLSTTLFVLGPEEGKKFLDDKLKLLVGDMEVSALWIMDGGRQEIYGNARFQGN